MPPPRGLLRKPVAPGEHVRLLPARALRPWVAHYWWVTWKLARPFVAETLSHPSVHLVFEGGRWELAGVQRKRFTRTLRGEGWVFGVKFRPGAFQPWWGASVAPLTDRRVRYEAPRISLARAVEVIEPWLLARRPGLPRAVEEVRDLAERIAGDRSLIRVENAAAALGVDVRTLQRRFRHAVGVGPKWVIQRYRLHEAAERLKAARAPALADLAVELGYFDQAHFAREFRAVIGRSPRRFVAEESR